MKWEYKIITENVFFNEKHIDNMDTFLNKYGLDEWELFNMEILNKHEDFSRQFNGPTLYRLFFKRQVK